MKLTFEFVVKKKINKKVKDLWIKRETIDEKEIFEKIIVPQYQDKGSDWELELLNIVNIEQ